MSQEVTTVTEQGGWRWGCSGQATPQDRRNLRHVNYWLFGWVVVGLGSMMIAVGPGDGSLAISSLALTASGLAFVPVVAAYRRFLREADELTKLIQIQAMATAFAAGLVVGFLDPLIERVVSFLPPLPIGLEAHDIFNPLMVMIITYSVTVVVLQRQYR